MNRENWKYFIDAKIPLDAYSFRSERNLEMELPAGMSSEALSLKVKNKFGGRMKNLVEIERVEILPTVDGTYKVKDNKLKRCDDGEEYLMHGFRVRFLGNAPYFTMLKNDITPLNKTESEC